MRFADQSNFRPAQQGQLDGFCGIYAGVNFILRRRYICSVKCESHRKIGHAIFLDLLKGLNKKSRLKPKSIINGFNEKRIAKSLNSYFEHEKLEIQAQKVKEIVKARKSKTPFDLVQSLAPNEACILLVNDGKHWILAHSGTANQFIADDSDGYDRPRTIRRKNAEKHKISLKEGVVLLNAQ